MNNSEFSSQSIDNDDIFLKALKKLGMISGGQLRQPSKKTKKRYKENSDDLNWNLEITDEDKIDQLNAMIVGAAKRKYYSEEEQYARALKEIEEFNLISDAYFSYFRNPLPFFNIFCNELCFTFGGISWDLIQRFQINIKTEKEEKVYQRLISCLKTYIKDTNTYADDHSGYKLILSYYSFFNKISNPELLMVLFKKHFFYYNDMPVFYLNNTVCVVSEKSINLFLKSYGYPYNFSSLNLCLSNTLYYPQKNLDLFHYYSYRDDRIRFNNPYNNNIYAYKFDKTTKSFEVVETNLFEVPAINFEIPANWNEKQYKNYIYRLTQGSRETFDNIAKLLASLFLSGSSKNLIHIILVNEECKKMIIGILKSSSIIQPDKDMSTFLRRSVGQYTVQQYKNKKAFLIESLDEDLNSLQIDKIKKLINAKRLTQKTVINGTKHKTLFTNSLAIIGITSNISVAKTYESFQANIIDLTPIKDLESPFFIPGLYNWCRLPWTLYGISLLENKTCTPKPIKAEYFANQYFNEFVKKYVSIKDVVNDDENKKRARKERNFTFKNELFDYYNRLFSSMYPEITLNEKQNSLTKRFRERFPGLIEVRPHTSSNSSNSRAFLGLTLNSQAIQEEIDNYNLINQSKNNQKRDSIPCYADSDFIKLMQECEALVPEDLNKIVCNRSQLKVTIT
nr:hypothetical protein [uncultured Lachnoclostridium sp.]